MNVAFRYPAFATATLLCIGLAAAPTARAATPPTLNLPSGPIYADYMYPGTTSTYDLTLLNVPPGFDVTNTTYPDWCVEANGMPPSNWITLYSSYGPMPLDAATYQDPTVPAVASGRVALGAPVPWDELNYLLNHKEGSFEDVQTAIWLLIWGAPGPYEGVPSTIALDLLKEAETYGQGFVPVEGDVVGVIAYEDGIRSQGLQDTVFEVPVPKHVRSALGDFVWEDLNANGVQDAGEPGIPGVTVDLFSAGPDNQCGTTDDVMTASTTTNGTGIYGFNGLDAGTYCLKFTAPAGYSFSPPNATTDDKDSDANPPTGMAGPIVLPAGTTDLTWDAGLYRKASLGDFVWLDTNQNGLQDAGEPGVGNVTVNLLNCAQQMVATTTTASSGPNTGYYLFDNLMPGCYVLQFVLPNGYTFTTPNVGSNDQIDSDVAPTTGLTAQIQLRSGQVDLSWDAGLIRNVTCGLDVDVTCEVLTPPPSSFVCSSAKPLDSISMEWAGTQTIDIKAWKGSVGSTLLATRTNIKPGDVVTVTGYAGSPNDVYWQIYQAGTNFGTLLGTSTFHLSCSDVDMDGPDDCGKAEGNGKGKTGYLNLWILEGMGGSNGMSFSCTPPSTGGSDQCSAAPGSDVLYHYTVSNSGSPLVNVTLNDSELGQIDGTFNLGTNASKSFDVTSTVWETTTNEVTASGQISGDGTCAAEDDTTVTTSYESCAACKGGITQLALQHVGSLSNTTTVAVYEGDKANSDHLLYQGQPGTGVFLVQGRHSDGTMGSTISIWINGVLNAKVKTDCSLTLGPGAMIGEFEVVSGNSKDGGLLCPVSGGGGTFTCSKPFSELDMKWNGQAFGLPSTVYVTAWKGSVGSTALTTLAPATQGQVFTVTGLAGSPNDLYWQIYADPSGRTLLGTSTFHVSCSDVDMNSADDCGKAEGDGKGKTGYLNDWILAGMVDSDERLICQ